MTTVGTVIMAVYKPDPDLLEQQIGSLREQTLQEWACLVGIDGRDDTASHALQQLVAGDPRFRVEHFESNVGHYLNFARLAELAAVERPRWIAFADQDDLWNVDKLERLVRSLGPNVSGVTGQARIVKNGLPIGCTARRHVSLSALLCSNQVTGSTSVFRGDVLELACPLPAPTTASYHDHWFGVISAGLGQHVFVPDVVQDYVQHDQNVLGEETEHTLRGRLGSLLGLGRGLRGLANTLANDRWGWRVEMARELCIRVPSAGREEGVSVIASGCGNWRTLVILVRCMTRGEVPVLRGAALFVGALLSHVSPSGNGRSR